MTGRRERNRKQLLDDLKETTEHSKFKEETLDGIMWRNGCGKGYRTGLQANT